MIEKKTIPNDLLIAIGNKIKLSTGAHINISKDKNTLKFYLYMRSLYKYCICCFWQMIRKLDIIPASIAIQKTFHVKYILVAVDEYELAI